MSDLVSIYHPYIQTWRTLMTMTDNSYWMVLLTELNFCELQRSQRVNTCAEEFISTFNNSLPPPLPWSGLLLVLFQSSRHQPCLQPPTNMNFSVIFLVLVAAVVGKKFCHQLSWTWHVLTIWYDYHTIFPYFRRSKYCWFWPRYVWRSKGDHSNIVFFYNFNF